MPRFDVKRSNISTGGTPPGRTFRSTLSENDVTRVSKAAGNLTKEAGNLGTEIAKGYVDRHNRLKEVERKNTVLGISADLSSQHMEKIEELKTNYTLGKAADVDGSGMTIDEKYDEDFTELQARYRDNWAYLDEQSKLELNQHLTRLSLSGKQSMAEWRLHQLKENSKLVNDRVTEVIGGEAYNAGKNRNLSTTMSQPSAAEFAKAEKEKRILPVRSGYDSVARSLRQYQKDQQEELVNNIINTETYIKRVNLANSTAMESYIKGRLNTEGMPPEDALIQIEFLRKQFDAQGFDEFIIDADTRKQLDDMINTKKKGLETDISQQATKDRIEKARIYKDNGIKVYNEIGQDLSAGNLTNDQINSLDIDELSHDGIPGKQALRKILAENIKEKKPVSNQANLAVIKTAIATNPTSITPAEILALTDPKEENRISIDDALKQIDQWKKAVSGTGTPLKGKFDFLNEELKRAKKGENNVLYQFPSSSEITVEDSESYNRNYNEIHDKLWEEFKLDPKQDVDKLFKKVIEPYKKKEEEFWLKRYFDNFINFSKPEGQKLRERAIDILSRNPPPGVTDYRPTEKEIDAVIAELNKQ